MHASVPWMHASGAEIHEMHASVGRSQLMAPLSQNWMRQPQLMASYQRPPGEGGGLAPPADVDGNGGGSAPIFLSERSIATSIVRLTARGQK